MKIAFFHEGLGSIAGPHAEKREIAAASKRLKVAAGVRYAVYFVKRIGKIGDAWSGIAGARCCAIHFVTDPAVFRHPSFSPSAWRN